MVKLSTTVDPGSGEIHLGLVGRMRSRIGDYSRPVRLWRHHKPRWLWTRTNPVGRLTAEYVRRHGLVVRHGPFEGLRYPPEAVARTSYLVPKLVGTYERQLHTLFRAAGRYSTFVEVGASDGFYCVGFARMNPRARVIAFETDRVERRIASRMSALNGVDLEIRGTAGPAELAGLPVDGTLLMVDIEGAEVELLDPAATPTLARTALLVEAHVGMRPQVVEVLTDRFASTHDVQVFRDERTPPQPPDELRGLSKADVALLLSEGRASSDTWLYFTPTAP